MSYTIFYDKLMIKVDDRYYMPLLLRGASNVRDQNGKRERKWTENHLLVRRHKIISTKDEMEEHLHQWMSGYPDNVDDLGKYVGIQMNWVSNRGATRRQFMNMVKFGIKHAIDVNDFLRSVVFSLNNERVRTKNELLGKYTQLRLLGKEIEVSLDDYYGDIRRLKRKVCPPRRRRNLSNYNDLWVLTLRNCYFVRLLKYGYRYHYFPYAAKKYISEKEARYAAGRISKITGVNWRVQKIKKINGTWKVV